MHRIGLSLYGNHNSGSLVTHGGGGIRELRKVHTSFSFRRGYFHGSKPVASTVVLLRSTPCAAARCRN